MLRFSKPAMFLGKRGAAGQEGLGGGIDTSLGLEVISIIISIL